MYAFHRESNLNLKSSKLSKSTKTPEKSVHVFSKLSHEQIVEKSNRLNAGCVFSNQRFVGNEEAAERFCDILYSCLDDQPHLGPIFLDAAASSGKTHSVKLLAKGADWPFAEFDTPNTRRPEEVIRILEGACEQMGKKFEDLGVRGGKKYYKVAKCIGFWDEFHKIGESMLTSMLRAMERKDSTIICKDAIYDCSDVLWVVATTHIGRIYKINPAMVTRFIKIKLNAPSLEEVAKIISIQPFAKNWSMEECCLAVKNFGLISREVLLLGEQVNVKMRRKGIEREDAISMVAKEEGYVDGMKGDELRLLSFLSNQYPNRVTYADMSSATDMDSETLRGMFLPNLVKAKMIRRRGFTITLAGANALKERNLIDDKLHGKIVESEVANERISSN